MSSLTLRPVGSSDWDAYVGAQPAATPFHTSAFLTTAAAGLERDLVLLAADADGQQVGAIPLLVRRRKPFGSVNWYPLISFVGPLTSSPWVPEVVNRARKHASGVILLETYDCEAQPAASVPGSWSATTWDNYVLHLEGQTADGLRAAMGRNTRSQIKRGLATLTADHATRSELVDLFPTWTAHAFALTGESAPYPPTLVADVADAMESAGPVLKGAVRLDGQPLCLHLVFRQGDRAFVWQQASDPEHRKLGSGLSAHWQAIQWALEQGCRTIEFAGAPSAGLARMKLSLGAVPTPVVRYHRQSRVLTAANNVRGLTRGRSSPAAEAEPAAAEHHDSASG